MPGKVVSGFPSGIATRMNELMTSHDDSDHLLDLLKASGARITKPRRVIVRILAEKGGQHPDAMDIFRRAVREDSRISLPTVYRTLKVLEERTPLLRCHKQHLVNIDAINEIVLLEGGLAKIKTQSEKLIPISRRYFKTIKKKLLI